MHWHTRVRVLTVQRSLRKHSLTSDTICPSQSKSGEAQHIPTSPTRDRVWVEIQLRRFASPNPSRHACRLSMTRSTLPTWIMSEEERMQRGGDAILSMWIRGSRTRIGQNLPQGSNNAPPKALSGQEDPLVPSTSLTSRCDLIKEAEYQPATLLRR